MTQTLLALVVVPALVAFGVAVARVGVPAYLARRQRRKTKLQIVKEGGERNDLRRFPVR